MAIAATRSICAIRDPQRAHRRWVRSVGEVSTSDPKEMKACFLGQLQFRCWSSSAEPARPDQRRATGSHRTPRGQEEDAGFASTGRGRSRRTTAGQLEDKKRTAGGQHPDTGFRGAAKLWRTPTGLFGGKRKCIQRSPLRSQNQSRCQEKGFLTPFSPIKGQKSSNVHFCTWSSILRVSTGMTCWWEVS